MLPAVTYLLPSRTPHPRDSSLQGEGPSRNKGSLFPAPGGRELGWLSFLRFSVCQGYLRFSAAVPPGGVPSSTTLELRSGRGAPGHRGLFQGLRRDPGGVWGVSLQEKEGTKPERRQIQSADQRLLWPLLRGRGVAAAILPSSLPGPILCTPGPPPLPSSRSR